MSIGIYKITSPSNKVYIGQSRNIEKRFRGYRNLKCKLQHKLYNSFVKYGIKNHMFEIIEECNIETLNEKETYYIKKYNSIIDGLNIRGGGCGGGSLSLETKLKIGQALKGRKNTWTKVGSKGYKYTEEQKAKMRKPRVNKWIKKNSIPEHLVLEIREKFNSGKYTKIELSTIYNVSWGTIQNIINKLNSYNK